MKSSSPTFMFFFLKRISFTVSFTVGVLSAAVIGCASSPKAAENPCLKRRGAIDIGSGSTKAFAAIVDVCTNPKRIAHKLFDEKTKISFGEALEKSEDGKIPADVMTDASAKIATLAEAMSKEKLESITLVATAAFRKAKNGREVGTAISEATKVRLKGKTSLDPKTLDVQILTQENEAEIGAQAALSNLPPLLTGEVSRPIVVWDIGGGSMQMLAVGESHESFRGELASVTFKNRVIQEIQKKDPKVQLTPNPLGKSAKKAVTMARVHAKANVGKAMKDLAPKARWVGVGGVLAISVQKQVEREGITSHSANRFSEKALAQALDKRSLRNDDEIESEYRTTEITNLALVLGYMQELKIDQVETVEASLTQGLITR